MAEINMNATQEPKYKIEVNEETGQAIIVNRQSGECIPSDEPMFLLRGKDRCAVEALAYYRSLILNHEHAVAVGLRVAQFKRFAEECPDRMHEPDTQLTEEWPR